MLIHLLCDNFKDHQSVENRHPKLVLKRRLVHIERLLVELAHECQFLIDDHRLKVVRKVVEIDSCGLFLQKYS